jgi:hypothetical protein
MTLKSIIPTEMTQIELKHVCTELFIAKNWGADHSIFTLANGLGYEMPVTRWADYNEQFKGLN